MAERITHKVVDAPEMGPGMKRPVRMTEAEMAEVNRATEGKPEHDPVNHPSHYTSLPACCSKCGHPIECIDVTRHMGFNIGNAVKYLWREGLKAGVEDLRKAVWYVNDEVAKRLGIRPEDQFKLTPDEIELILAMRDRRKDLALEKFRNALKV